MNRRMRPGLSIVLLLAALPLAGQESAPPAIPNLVTSPLPFIGITPCRIADTRNANMPPGFGPPSLVAGQARNFFIAGQCGIPVGARAVSLNVTVVNPLGFGFVLLFPSGDPQPGVSTINYVPGLTVANAAFVPLGQSGSITVKSVVSGTDFLIDTNGYYAPSAVDITNTFVGLGAGNTTTTGLHNTGFGWGALESNTTGAENTAIGSYALRANLDGSDNTAFGASALRRNTSGARNSAFGSGALSLNTTGSDNVAVGEGALTSNVVGSSNTAVGTNALMNSTGFFNTALGFSAGANLTSGDNNVYIGSAGASSESNTLRIGEPATQTRFFLQGVWGVTPSIPDYVPVFVDTNHQVGTLPSSARFKEDIRDIGDDPRVLSLRPVSFRYKGRVEKHYGFVAEEVQEVIPELVLADDAGEPQAVMSHELPALLLNELQRQHREIRAQDVAGRRLEERISVEEREAAEILDDIAALEARIARHEGSARRGE